MIILSTIALILSLLFLIKGLPILELEWRNYYFNKIKWHNRITRNQFQQIDSFFASRFTYYKKLDAEGRAKFIYRSLEFMEDWEFEGRRGVVVDHAKKLLVCGAAAQLTYGLDNFRLDYFHSIFLYPDTFYSDLAEAEVKGLTYSTGQVAFSWKDFEEGFRIDTDGYNLGLHEMAHALEVNHKKLSRSDKVVDLYFADFIENSVYQHKLFVKRGGGFLRERALANRHEFFAVCVENFFEVPQEFRKNLPDIYNHLCILLNQNPLNTSENYRLKPGFIDNANENSSWKIPGYLKTLRKAYTPRILGLYSLLIFPALYFLTKLITKNPDHVQLIASMAGVGATLFLVFHFRSEFMRDNENQNHFVLVFNLLRGGALSITLIFIFSHTFWKYPKNVRYRLNETTLNCNNSYCRLKNLSIFDYPEKFKSLSTYHLDYSDLKRFEEMKVPVYFEERSVRGMFGLLIDYHFAIVVGDQELAGSMSN